MRKYFQLEPGSIVSISGEAATVEYALGLESLMVTMHKSGERKKVNVSELQKEAPNAMPADLLSDEDFTEANRRLDIIRPVMLAQSNGESKGEIKKIVAEASRKGHCTKSTIYRWIEKYRSTERLASLVPQKSGVVKGSVRISKQADELLNEIIKEHYLGNNQKKIPYLIDLTKRIFRKEGIPVPHPNTIRNRVNFLNTTFKEYKVRKRRKSQEIDYKEHEPFRTNTNLGAPGYGEYQIDHTPVDVILVDEIDRKPIGRPYLTLAMNPTTRMVCGYYLSMDAPGDLAVGQCLVNAILPKKEFLEGFGIVGDQLWPVWGLPTCVHADNANEFRGSFLRAASAEYDFRIEWRPIKKPEYGGHIERLLGTIMHKVHNIPGTTFSNIRQKGDYDSTGSAIMTLAEFEKWLVTFIVKYYHHKPHSSLEGKTPLQKLEEVIWGNDEVPGKGLPQPVTNRKKLFLDFLPSERRVVSPYGVQWDSIHYYHESLNPWIKKPTPDGKKKHLFKRDPRDISKIYFFEPKIQEYIPIPYRNITRPAMSIWELRESRKRVVEKGLKKTEEALFAAFNELHETIEESKVKTLKARKTRQRKKN